ncbi:YopX protein [compost metagenome]
MREILFRAFHKNEKKMYPVFSFCHAFVKIEVGIGTATEKIPINLFEPLMQFTGLTDKNGTKIFEGDILHKPFQSFVPKFIVEWNDKKACFDDIPLNTDSTSKASEFTIIGNIHDNPELLK